MNTDSESNNSHNFLTHHRQVYSDRSVISSLVNIISLWWLQYMFEERWTTEERQVRRCPDIFVEAVFRSRDALAFQGSAHYIRCKRCAFSSQWKALSIAVGFYLPDNEAGERISEHKCKQQSVIHHPLCFFHSCDWYEATFKMQYHDCCE